MDTVVGAALHRGWAVLVCVALVEQVPVVADRRRVTLVEPGVPSQPFHHQALELNLVAAEAVVRTTKTSVRRSALGCVRQLRETLAGGHDLGTLAVRQGRSLPRTLTEILDSRQLTHIADSEMYRDGLCWAARRLGMQVVSYPRSGEFRAASAALGVTVEQLRTYLTELRHSLGAPWHSDHQSATAAALWALARQRHAVPLGGR